MILIEVNSTKIYILKSYFYVCFSFQLLCVENEIENTIKLSTNKFVDSFKV